MEKKAVGWQGEESSKGNLLDWSLSRALLKFLILFLKPFYTDTILFSAFHWSLIAAYNYMDYSKS